MTTIRVAHVATVDLTHRFLLLDQLRRQRSDGYEVTAISSAGPWVDDLRRDGIGFIPWAITRAWDPPNDARALVELVRILRRGRFHVVHTHTPKGGVLGRVAARIAGVPCVVNTVHGLYATPDDPVRRRWPVLGVEWLAARFSDLELYQSARGPRVGSADPHRAPVPQRPPGQRRRPDAVRSRRRGPGQRRADPIRAGSAARCRGRRDGRPARRREGVPGAVRGRQNGAPRRSRRSGSSPSGTRTARSPMRSPRPSRRPPRRTSSSRVGVKTSGICSVRSTSSSCPRGAKASRVRRSRQRRWARRWSSPTSADAVRW